MGELTTSLQRTIIASLTDAKIVQLQIVINKVA